jgi:hypothetical protein
VSEWFKHTDWVVCVARGAAEGHVIAILVNFASITGAVDTEEFEAAVVYGVGF